VKARTACLPPLLAVLVSAPSLAGAQSVGPGRTDGASFEARPCPFWSADESERFRVECGSLIVPEGGDSGPRYRVQVAILRSHGERLYDDAIVVIPGGPGGHMIRGGAARLAQNPLQDSLRQHRDIVLMDARGTGYSEPGELCPAFEGLEVRAAILRLPFEERTALVRRELAACRARLQQEGIDPGRFNSAALAHDLESLRSALGYQRLNLIGISWGTRVVLETMRRFPESVRSAILYGPLPPDAPWHVAAATTGASLERLLRQCATDVRCRSEFPSLDRELAAMLDELDDDPIPLKTRWGAVEIDGAVAETMITHALYDSDFLRYVPLAIRELRRRNAGFVEVLMRGAMGAGSSGGFYYAARCFELAPPLAADSLERLRERYPWLGRAHRAAPDLATVCEGFIPARTDSTVIQPVRSDVPTLIFAGEFDPTTPPEFGQRAAATLPNAHLLVLRGQGHDVNVPTPCTAEIRARFLDNPLEPPDTSCLGTLPPLSFATNVHVNAAVPRLVSRLALTRDAPWIIGTALLFLPLLTGAVLLPVGWLSRRRRRSEERGAALATGVIWAAAAVAALFMLGLGTALWTTGDRYLALFGVPASWGWLFVLPALALALAAAGAVGFVTGWRRRWWSPRGRMLRGVVAAASVAFVVIAVWAGIL
jgi:pimeloyl-ACP methyl ester carboxylesterase